MSPRILLLIALSALPFSLSAQDRQHAALPSPYGTYGDNGLPFFTQTLDARHLGMGWPKDNIAPRGIIIHLGEGYHACFDPDLLRIALIWKESGPGDYLQMNGMAPGSYRKPHQKSPGGQKNLPTPIGTPVLATGLYPGIQTLPLKLRDPRERATDQNEHGLGPLPEAMGKWHGLRLVDGKPVLEYEIRGTSVREQWNVRPRQGNSPPIFERFLHFGPRKPPLFILHDSHDPNPIPNGGFEQTSLLSYRLGKEFEFIKYQQFTRAERVPVQPPARIWPEKVTRLQPKPSPSKDALAIDQLPLPLPNPWKRNVRPSDIDFFPDGRLALATLDGDVWLADGLDKADGKIVWQRFASGLHEPMGIRVLKGEIVVSDRNGLIHLRDTDENGEADFYENVSNAMAQTGETREFAMSFEAKPDGGYYVAKGGQQGSTLGKHNGTILEISPDGRDAKIVATGLRQPFLGLNQKTGLLTASDQQGHWMPATPIQIIERDAYYGFQPTRLGPKANDGKTITEPQLWVPHFVNQSGARQLWLHDAKMGALNDSLLHIGYNQPAIFKLYFDEDQSQGAITPLTSKFATGLLGGRVNPKDGLLYLAGLNLWGTTGKKIQGLYRVRPTEQPLHVPISARVFKEGVVLKFNDEVDPKVAALPGSYAIDRWNYKRSNKYGSGHYKPDGTPGQEPLPVGCVYLSEDHYSVFLGIPDMKTIDTLRVTYRVSEKVSNHVCFTVRKLKPIDLTLHGFEETQVEYDHKASLAGRDVPAPTAPIGKALAKQYGCIACHSDDGTKKVAEEPSLVVGPSWKGLFGSERTFTDGKRAKADESYLRESILEPSKRVTKGFESGTTGVGMPSYRGVLRDDQIESLILYLKSLAE